MEVLKLVINLLPLLIQLIRAVESAIPEAGKGGEKLALVRSILETVDTNIPPIWPAIEKVIGAIVGAFNKTGVFAKPEN